MHSNPNLKIKNLNSKQKGIGTPRIKTHAYEQLIKTTRDSDQNNKLPALKIATSLRKRAENINII